ncbi:MAG: branched-chain amino acid ABC transporter substrate-binding protein, partial [Caldilinea sp.]
VALVLVLIVALMAGCVAPAAPGVQPAAAEAQPEAAGGQVVIAPGQPIRIGGSFALTGPIPDPGKDIRQAAEIAVDELNAAGGVEGFLFELVVEDGACSGDQGTVVGNKFAADPTIVAVSGGTCSGETFGLKPILLKARIPFVSPSATNPDVTGGDCDICNRVALSDAMQGQIDAEFVMNELGLSKVAVIHDNSDYGKGLAEIFQSAMIALGGEVTHFEGVQVGDTDFRAALAKIGASQPELIFFGGYSTEAALITQQMKETAGLENTQFMSDDGAYTQQYLQAAGAAAEGAYMSFVAGDQQAEKLTIFNEAYIAKFGVEPSQLGPFHGQSYDSIMLISDAISRVAEVDGSGNLVIDREALIAAIRATEGLDGITGMITCNEIGECGAGGVQIFVVENGEFKQVAGFGL